MLPLCFRDAPWIFQGEDGGFLEGGRQTLHPDCALPGFPRLEIAGVGTCSPCAMLGRAWCPLPRAGHTPGVKSYLRPRMEEFFLPHPLCMGGNLPETWHQVFPLVPWELQKVNPSADMTLAIPSPGASPEEGRGDLDYGNIERSRCCKQRGLVVVVITAPRDKPGVGTGLPNKCKESQSHSWRSLLWE